MHRDAIITCVVNSLTCLLAGGITFSILGYIAHAQGAAVADVVSSGPGLVFITYPEVVQLLPGAPAWAFIFFFMLLVRVVTLLRNGSERCGRGRVTLVVSLCGLPTLSALASR